jgi:hypothetical protein
MAPIPSFAVAAGAWQNFYVLVGTAAATLIGLMFVAITFGASLVTRQTAQQARAFIDPSFTHFVQVLFTACLVLIPTMIPSVLGGLLLAISALRTAVLRRVLRHMREAHRVHHDVELSDWLTGIAIPLLCHALLGATGAAFLAGYVAAFNALALVTIAILLNGIFSAWELMLWMAMVRAGTK